MSRSQKRPERASSFRAADRADDRSFLALHSFIAPRAITEFVYRYSSSFHANIFLSFYLSSPSLPNTQPPASGTSTPALSPSQIRLEELSSILSSLKTAGMDAMDLTDNELAKSHARYLVGGKMEALAGAERVFRFEFPEREGALRRFLEGLAGRFSITLFHYRNHGGGSSPYLPSS